ncbi:ABC transporter ATP-binding protein YtrB [Polystyrenella longa]|uniref:ABC transporter ATP-binding protein YtrB n=1 Tax=Polystyrenella longa TaxID=2528007 RepID=A0A518CKP1_9PLAN|nr:ABC transporter ATP-binding protein [Polystyrenella longa]QDU79791.1 ABC transporter ATP-binding protein YtrB [Polystyrenella longa]
MTEYVLQTDRLTRYFGSKCAVNELSLSVPRGGVFALLGRNGAGKTTAIRMLMGFLQPTRGTATILGTDCSNLTPAIRGRIAYVAEGHFLYKWMTIAQLEQFQKNAALRWNQKLFRAVLDHFALDEKMKAGALSRGQRAGVCLALALAPEPELIILDDPTIGLDPVARRALVEAMLMVTQNRDRTILFSSHQLDDVERVADWIAIMLEGDLRVCCTPDEFRDRLSRWVLKFDDGGPPSLEEIPELVHEMRFPNELHLTLANASPETISKLQTLATRSCEQLPLNLENGVIDYLSDKSRGGSLLHTMGGLV